MLYLRKILLFAFVAIYLVFCPLLIFYSFGRIARPGGQDASSGLIFLSTSPSGGTVYVEGRRFTKKTPTALSGMLPGFYDISITLAGYQSWNHKIQTFPKLASVYDRILMVPQEWKTRVISEEPFSQLISIPSSRFFILAKGSRLYDYYSFDSASEELTPFVHSASGLGSLEVARLFKVEGSSQVVIKARTFSENKYILVRPEKSYVSIKDISRFIVGNPQQIIWGPDEPNYLFVYENNRIDKVDILNQQLDRDYLDHLKGYGLFNGKIYILKDINTLFRADYDRGNQKILLNDPILGNFLFGRDGFFQVKPLDEDIAVFLGEDGRFLSNRLPHRIAEKGVRGLEYHWPSKRVLFWMKSQAGVIDYQPIFSAQPAMARVTPTEGYWFYSKGREVTQAFWAYQGNYVILVDNENVFIFELKDKGESQPNKVVSIASGSLVHYREDSGQLYYLDSKTKKLSCVDIIDQNQAKPLSFREYLSRSR